MKNKVFAVCNELEAQGVKVIQSNVRDALGGGSYSTIVPLIKEWRETGGKGEGKAKEQAAGVPAEIGAEVARFSNAIWGKCTNYFEKLIEAIRTEYAAKIEAMEAELEGANNEIKELERENAALKHENGAASKKDETISDLSKTNSELSKEILKFFEEKQALQRKNEGLEQNYERQAKEIERLLKIVESVQNSDTIEPDPAEGSARWTEKDIIEAMGKEIKPKKRSTKKPTPALQTEQQTEPAMFYYVLNDDDIIKEICPTEQNATLTAESLSQVGKKHRAKKSVNVYDIEQQFKG